ncbi:hypothetical protein [Mangrovimonas spongiae]|uniref:Uncharacterized protein n=1 Tax=Mangrovimonas spongiae TaxID=2494697 RepID=A0A428JY59_9FLAO|nr:hypothetical protein [Mangrovimonas spongiae]RSK39079.1 hypothetical protein EJA19_09050 [Mangrovimonas spongiae]
MKLFLFFVVCFLFQSSLINSDIYKLNSTTFFYEINNNQEGLEKTDLLGKEKQILIHRVELAKQKRHTEYKKFILYTVLLGIVVLSLMGHLLYNLQQQKKKHLRLSNKLKETLKSLEIQNKFQEQHLKLSKELYANVETNLSCIISSIESLKYEFSIQDNTLLKQLNNIHLFTDKTMKELQNTIVTMNKEG